MGNYCARDKEEDNIFDDALNTVPPPAPLKDKMDILRKYV